MELYCVLQLPSQHCLFPCGWAWTSLYHSLLIRAISFRTFISCKGKSFSISASLILPQSYTENNRLYSHNTPGRYPNQQSWAVPRKGPSKYWLYHKYPSEIVIMPCHMCTFCKTLPFQRSLINGIKNKQKREKYSSTSKYSFPQKNLSEAVSFLNEQKIETQSLFQISIITSSIWMQEWQYWDRQNASVDKYLVSSIRGSEGL